MQVGHTQQTEMVNADTSVGGIPRCWGGSLLCPRSWIYSIMKASQTSYHIITELVQGRTRRWAVGWSFEPWRSLMYVLQWIGNNTLLTPIPQAVGRISHLPGSHALHKVLPSRTTLSYPFPGTMPTAVVEAVLKSLADDISFSYSSIPQLSGSSQAEGVAFLVKAAVAVWSRAARRKRKREIHNPDEEQPLHKHQKTASSSTPSGAVSVEGSAGNMTWLMICMVRLSPHYDGASSAHGGQLESQWIYGHDRTLFEGFSSHLSKRVCTRE